ncbi:hypothetical protein DM02DRAFT_617076 [Periconia macrospinosa]|uniref:Uncharacterized protein n=1 Tax=Periconia macrospinosa TaxID=97972 RepID=A0A2V1DF40_9PLEO|nr:hypothetical protein DM02DRAFT_617076 [Periconia macrospinosa]
MGDTFSPILRALSPSSRLVDSGLGFSDLGMSALGSNFEKAPSTWGGTVQGESAPSEWEEDKLANLLAVWLIFEREILSLSAVDVVRTYWPLSHALTYTAIDELRHEKKMLMKKFTAKMRQDGKKLRNGEGKNDKEHRRAEWEKVYNEWVQQLAWEDEDDQENEKVLAQGRKDWWDEVEQVGICNIIRRVRKLEAQGQRVGISFRVAEEGEEAASENESDTASPVPSPHFAPASLFKNTYEGFTNSNTYTIPSYNRSPHVSALSFPIPIQTLSPPPLLAYLSFLNEIVIFATEETPDAIAHHVTTIRDRTTTRKQSLARNLRRAATMVDMKKEDMKELMKLLGEKKKSSDDEKAGQQQDEEDQDVLERVVTLVNERRDKGRAGMEDWLRRYEEGGGFVVPRRMELLVLLEGRGGRKGGEM